MIVTLFCHYSVTDYSGDFSGSGDNWGSGSGSGSGSSGSGSGWEEIKAWRDNDDEDY